MGISGVLVLLAGLLLLLFGMGLMDASTSHIVGGAVLALYGIFILVHAANKCPLCKKGPLEKVGIKI